MLPTLYLTCRYIRFHRLKTSLLVAAVAMTLLMPAALTLLVRGYEQSVAERADATPLVLGAKGNRFDLTLAALYFRAGRIEPVTAASGDRAAEDGSAFAIPLHVGFTARQMPLVGTSVDYFEFRGLRFATGRPFGLLGEAVLGADVARELGLGLDDRIATDAQNLYDISKNLPVRLRVSGVLAPAGTADDGAVFVDLRTTWIVEGLGHGHEELDDTTDDAKLLARGEDRVTAAPSLPTYLEITEANAADFHFHGDESDFPVSAFLVVPRDAKASTILKARYRVSEREQLLVPREVVGELMGIVFRIKRFFDANFLLVAISTGMMLAVVVMLSVRLRAGEFETLRRIGALRGTVVALQAGELVMDLLLASILAAAVAAAVVAAAPDVGSLL